MEFPFLNGDYLPLFLAVSPFQVAFFGSAGLDTGPIFIGPFLRCLVFSPVLVCCVSSYSAWTTSSTHISYCTFQVPHRPEPGKEMNANCNLSAASALAANSILRSTAGAGFPLFATYMVRNPLSKWYISEWILRYNVVQRIRSQLDWNPPRLRRGRSNAYSSLILPLWPQDSGEEHVLHGLYCGCSSSQWWSSRLNHELDFWCRF